MAVMIFQSVNQFSRPRPVKISYSLFRDHIREGHIESAEIQGEQIRGRYQSTFQDGERYETRWVGTGDELTKFLEENRIKFSARSEENSAFWQQN